MGNSRKRHFESQTSGIPDEEPKGGIWELPDHVAETVVGALDFYETVGGGIDFAQNFSCFAQGIGDFSSGTRPQFEIEPRFG